MDAVVFQPWCRPSSTSDTGARTVGCTAQEGNALAIEARVEDQARMEEVTLGRVLWVASSILSLMRHMLDGRLHPGQLYR